VRKSRQDGLLSAAYDSVETVYRREVFPAIFSFLLEYNKIRLLDEDEVRSIAKREVQVCESSTDYSVYCLDSGYMFPASGLMLTDDFKLISASIGSPQYSRRFTGEALAHHDFVDPVLTPRLLLKRQKISHSDISGAACLLSPRYQNYFHWMVETIPKIRYVEEYERKTGDDVTYVLPSDLPSWGAESLSLLGYSEEKVTSAQFSSYQADELIIPPHPFRGSYADYDWIRKNVFENLTREDESSHRIFISRSNAIGRRISNKNEVMDILSEYGFEKRLLENQSVSQNVRDFLNADIIVAPHGAGLADVIFCQNNCTVIELFGSRHNKSYQDICDVLQIPYKRIDCKPDATDIIVDTTVLRQTLGDTIDE